jgi:5-(carboxyamino)imidazole ribonucleotide synthase
MSHPFAVSSGFKLGIIGGGQLARMTAYEAFRYGIKVGAVCQPSGKDPMEEVTPHVFRGGVSDPDTLEKLANWADVITLENEFLDADVLAEVQKRTGTPVFPSPETFRLIENKRIEKETFRNAGIPVADFCVVGSIEELPKIGARMGWPFILKSSKGGYDGYGNVFAGNKAEAEAGFRKLGGDQGREIIAEECVNFTKELAVMVARNEHGMVAYPCVETVQENHICKQVMAPAPISRDLRDQTVALAKKATEAIDGKGMFGFEFFLDEHGQILLNESAPRPHNSGHFSIEACSASQFHNHFRAVAGLPLIEPVMRYPSAVMINLLGKENGEAVLRMPRLEPGQEEVHLHSYGKKDGRIGRKMGHITVLGANDRAVLKKAQEVETAVVL